MSTITSRKQSDPAPAVTRSQRIKAGWSRYIASLKYSLHVITHPFDGFWDLVHENRGSLAAANTILVLFLMTRILKLLYTDFQFINSPIQYIDVFEQVASLLLPFLILCIANWAGTTLFDGKGRFKDIYMAMCYALVPYILLQLPLILVSNIITFDEASFYNVLMGISVIWCVFLAFVGLMEVHDYGPLKTIIFLFATVFGACVIIFLLLIFFSLLSDAAGYIVSFVREIVFRLY
ncbi:MAG: YIP1 family protein [Clostridiales bacterium]|nr:YIP1 family protein [Clostridiales bacterium]